LPDPPTPGLSPPEPIPVAGDGRDVGQHRGAVTRRHFPSG
jgi:hypothetical protein